MGQPVARRLQGGDAAPAEHDPVDLLQHQLVALVEQLELETHEPHFRARARGLDFRDGPAAVQRVARLDRAQPLHLLDAGRAHP